MPSKRVVLAGGSGFLGQSLAASLLASGYEVVVLTRRPNDRSLLGTGLSWDGVTVGDWARCLDDALAVVNLAGKSVNCRHTPDNRREIIRSRIDSVRAVAEAVGRSRRPPRTLVQVSATGIYGDAGDRICDESTPPGTGFFAETCMRWEEAFWDGPMSAEKMADRPGPPGTCTDESGPNEETAGAIPPGVRRVVLRLGVVLGVEGGALPTLARLARAFLGGRVASGRQYISWLHLADLNRMVHWAITREEANGIYNATSPGPVTNAQFMRELRVRLHRPWSPPAPAWAVRLGTWLLGVDASLALTGQRCVPPPVPRPGVQLRVRRTDPRLGRSYGYVRRCRAHSPRSAYGGDSQLRGSVGIQSAIPAPIARLPQTIYNATR